MCSTSLTLESSAQVASDAVSQATRKCNSFSSMPHASSLLWLKWHLVSARIRITSLVSQSRPHLGSACNPFFFTFFSLPPSQPASLPYSLHSLLPSSLSPSLSLFIPVAHRVEGYYNFLPTNYVCYKQKKACQTSLIIYILNQYHYPSQYSHVRMSVCLSICLKAQILETLIAGATKLSFHIN